MLAKDTSDKRPLSKIYEVLLKINKKTKQKPKIWFKNGAETLTDTSSKKSYRWQMGMWEEAPLHISLLQKRWQASPSSRRLGVWSGKHDKALWDNGCYWNPLSVVASFGQHWIVTSAFYVTASHTLTLLLGTCENSRQDSVGSFSTGLDSTLKKHIEENKS